MAVILVTGSSTGIGQETAIQLARSGHTVYASVRNPEGAGELAERITNEAPDARVIRLDLTDPGSIASAVAEIMASEGRIDALVANAGIGAGSSVEETPLEVAREIFETNYFGNISVLRAVTPIMREQRSGRIVMVGSLAGRYAAGCHGHYSASKWAMEGLCESLAQEMAEFGARVSIIEPGCVATPMWTKGTPSEAPPLYPVTLSRLVRFFEVGLSTPALPGEVAQAIEQVITAADPPFRVPVGRDAVEVIAGRDNSTGDEWIRMLCTAGDEAFAEGWKALVGRDYYGER